MVKCKCEPPPPPRSKPAARHCFAPLLSFLFAYNSLKQNGSLPFPFPLLWHSLYFVSSSPNWCVLLALLPPSAVPLMAFSIAITLYCLHKLVNHWHRRNNFFLHYRRCPLQFSNTSLTLKELLNHSLVYPLHPVGPKLMESRKEMEGERGTE